MTSTRRRSGASRPGCRRRETTGSVIPPERGGSLLGEARRIADEVLFPTAGEVEARGSVPVAHLDLLAEAGLYGIFATPGLDPVTAYRIMEVIAGGDLATALVWIQHHSALRTITDSDVPGVRERWLDPLAKGTVRAGVALGGLRPGPPLLRVRPTTGGYLLDGEAPWLTGWGLVDVVLVAARDGTGTASWLLIDARPASSLTLTWPTLLAVQASRTVHVRFDGHPVPADRLVGAMPFAQWPERDARGLRGNGSLALGLADRCCRLLGDDAGPLNKEVDQRRSLLDGVGVSGMPAARAATSALAYRCAATLMVASGARSMVVGDPSQKLLREAAFLLVFGGRPTIRKELLARLSAKD